MSESFLTKLQALKAYYFIKKRHQRRCFPMNFAKFLRAPNFKKISNGYFCNCSIENFNMEMRQTLIFMYAYRSRHQRCSIKKVFLEISLNSHENTCARVWHKCFSVNFVEFLRTPFYRTPLDDCSIHTQLL